MASIITHGIGAVASIVAAAVPVVYASIREDVREIPGVPLFVVAGSVCHGAAVATII